MPFFFFFFLAFFNGCPVPSIKTVFRQVFADFITAADLWGSKYQLAFLCIYKSTSNKLDFCTCGTLTAPAQMLPHPTRLEKLDHRQQQPPVVEPASQLALLGILCLSSPLPSSHVLKSNFPALHEFLPINSGSLEKV